VGEMETETFEAAAGASTVTAAEADLVVSA
jgi:hypothetical protein